METKAIQFVKEALIALVVATLYLKPIAVLYSSKERRMMNKHEGRIAVTLSL